MHPISYVPAGKRPDGPKVRWFTTALIATVAFASASLHAQTYPAKPVKVMVGFPPGQATDILARAVAEELSKSLGQQFYVDNRASAAGIIATEAVAQTSLPSTQGSCAGDARGTRS